MEKAYQRKETVLKTPYSDREFFLAGSAGDISVLGPIADSGGVWEPHIMNLMAHLVRPTDVCLDIGANIGAHTLALSTIANQGQVYAFEPSSITSEFLSENIRKNGFLHTHCERIGLGRAKGMQQFTHLVGMEGCSFLNPEGSVEDVLKTAWGGPLERRTETVTIDTLDGWASGKQIDRVDFVKMDAEGSELAVMDGGRHIFGSRPKLILELNRNTLSLYYGVDPGELFARLSSIYNFIYMIHDDSDHIPSPISFYRELEPHLAKPSHWWVDLLCLPTPYAEALRL